jgi:hypothetical protein
VCAVPSRTQIYMRVCVGVCGGGWVRVCVFQGLESQMGRSRVHAVPSRTNLSVGIARLRAHMCMCVSGELSTC